VGASKTAIMTSTSAQLVFENSGKPWSAQEDKQLIDEYKSGTNVEDICKIHKRKMGGISSRLTKLNLINNRCDIPSYSEYRTESRNMRLEETNLSSPISQPNIEVVHVKEKKKPSENQTKYVELQENVKEIKKDVKELKQTILQLTEMLKAIYEFEGEST
jgi:hypothetical protein